jgi:branched-subunit amino acid aminotransferase/4-amino-4-deoxychorismate lyase
VSDYGCFTTVRVEREGVRGWEAHLERLVRDSGLLFDRAVAREEVIAEVRRALAGLPRPMLARVAVTAADHTLGRPGGSDLGIAVTPRPVHDDPTPLAVATIHHRRALPQVKHLGITPELLARRRAHAAGYDDALLVADGLVNEGPTWSLVLLVDDVLVSPLQGLPSVTVGLLSRVRPIERREVRVDELAAATAAVAVNAGWGVRPIAAIDGRALPQTPARALDLATAYLGIDRDPI